MPTLLNEMLNVIRNPENKHLLTRYVEDFIIFDAMLIKTVTNENQNYLWCLSERGTHIFELSEESLVNVNHTTIEQLIRSNPESEWFYLTKISNKFKNYPEGTVKKLTQQQAINIMAKIKHEFLLKQLPKQEA